MDFFYVNFLKGLQQKQIQYLEIKDIKKLLGPLSRMYHSKMILSFYLPKVASSFLFSTLLEITKYKAVSLSWGYHHNEQNLDMNQIINTAEHDSLCKLVAKATDANVELIDLFGFKPIVITRSLLDILVSLRDHIVNFNNYQWPQLYINQDFFHFSKEKQYDLIIDRFTPWMIDFLVSWKTYQQQYPDLLWLTYEDICFDLQATIAKVFELNKIDISVKNLDQYIKTKHKTLNSYENTFNVGKSGRGKQEFSDDQLQRIDSFFVHCPELKSYL